MPFTLANSSSARMISSSPMRSRLALGWGKLGDELMFDVGVGAPRLLGLTEPSRASRLYVTPFTCSTSPCSMVPNCIILPSAGDKTAFGLGSKGRAPGFRVR